MTFWLGVLIAPLVWAACGTLWLLGVLVGIPLTLIASLSKAYEWYPGGGDRNEGYWFYTWPIMKYWQTWDNGACAYWYRRDRSNWPLWFCCWVYSGWRNAFGGNPFNLARVHPGLIKYRSDSGSNVRLTTRMIQDRARGETRRVYWLVTQFRFWFTGVWILFPFHLKPGANNSHFEIRHGWKLYPDATQATTMVFSLWDTGPRFR